MPPTIERLRYLFNYNPNTGELSRRVDTARGRAGFVFKRSATVYAVVWVDGERRQLHNICFAMHNGYWPSGIVDHRDRDISNTKADNLREATSSQNQYNRANKNPNGKGVSWRNRLKNPWIAKIRIEGTLHYLGSFATPEEAAAAYRAACLKYHGEFACLD